MHVDIYVCIYTHTYRTCPTPTHPLTSTRATALRFIPQICNVAGFLHPADDVPSTCPPTTRHTLQHSTFHPCHIHTHTITHTHTHIHIHPQKATQTHT